jgi:hypothetical protein
MEKGVARQDYSKEGDLAPRRVGSEQDRHVVGPRLLGHFATVLPAPETDGWLGWPLVRWQKAGVPCGSERGIPRLKRRANI